MAEKATSVPALRWQCLCLALSACNALALSQAGLRYPAIPGPQGHQVAQSPSHTQSPSRTVTKAHKVTESHSHKVMDALHLL